MGYIVVVRKSDGSDYGAEVLDLPGCVSSGSSMDQTHDMIVEATRIHIAGLVRDGEAVPPPRELKDKDIKALLTPEFKGDDFFALLEIDA